MDINDPVITLLRKHVKAMQEEFDQAVMFHEVWKPTANDDQLHKRMGKSYATQTFLVVRMALRREMILALLRIWDTGNNGGISLNSVAKILREKGCVIDVLAV